MGKHCLLARGQHGSGRILFSGRRPESALGRGLFLFLFLLLILSSLFPAAVAAEPFRSSRIAVEVRGSGKDVILVHGLAASPAVWNGTVRALPGYRYHLVRIAGFSGYPAGGNASGPVAARVADEIARYIRTSGMRRPALVGHSMGGSITLMVAARHPDSVGKAMVVDMVPAPAQLVGAPPVAARRFAGFLRTELIGTDRLRQDLKWLVGRFGSADWLDTNSDTAVVARSLEELIATDLTPELPRIRAPLAVLYACPEPLAAARRRIDRFYARAYAKRPGTRLVRVDRSGHTIMRDQPGLFRSALRTFLG